MLPFTCGPLAYLLRNRTYLGETSHKEHWYPGEHEAIVNPALFNTVQDLLKNNSVTRHQQRSDNQSLLSGLLFDDRNNRMSPSFSTKRGVRYRFYVSSAVLSGRRDESGSLIRVSAPELETRIVAALRGRSKGFDNLNDKDLIDTQIERIVVGRSTLLITIKTEDATGSVIRTGSFTITKTYKRTN